MRLERSVRILIVTISWNFPFFYYSILGPQNYESYVIAIFKQCYTVAKPVILEPVMLVELKVPTEFQGTVAGDINK